MKVGEKLRYLRRQRNMSVDRLAARSGVNPIAIRLYEGGFRQPGVDNLRRLSKALGKTLGAFHDCEPGTPTVRVSPKLPVAISPTSISLSP